MNQPKYRIAVVGSRTFNNYPVLHRILDSLGPSLGTVVSGGARGADSLAAQFARERKLPLREYLPDWNVHGKAAGFIRNKTIVQNCDGLIAFWDGQSRGTLDSIQYALKLGKPVAVYDFNGVAIGQGTPRG